MRVFSLYFFLPVLSFGICYWPCSMWSEYYLAQMYLTIWSHLLWIKVHVVPLWWSTERPMKSQYVWASIHATVNLPWLDMTNFLCLFACQPSLIVKLITVILYLFQTIQNEASLVPSVPNCLTCLEIPYHGCSFLRASLSGKRGNKEWFMV